MAVKKIKPSGIPKLEDLQLRKISVFFKRSILKSILKILVMEHSGFRTVKTVKNINRLFTSLDVKLYEKNEELKSFIWCISFFSKQWLEGIVNIDLIEEGAKRQTDYDDMKGKLISECRNDKNIISEAEAKMIFELIAEALQYGYLTSVKKDYQALLDDITFDHPGAFKELAERLFNISHALIDIKHSTNFVTNKVTFNTNDIESMRNAIAETQQSLSTSNSIFKTGIRRWNSLLSPGYMNGRLYIYLGLPGSGKAQPNDTQIPTPNGMKRLDELQLGDMVFNMYGDPVSVTNIFPQGIQDTYEVTMSDGRKTRCNIDHLWHVIVKSHGKDVVKVLTLKEIMKDYKYIAPGSPNHVHSKYMIPNNKVAKFNAQSISLDPWVLGYVIGNGCCRETEFKVSCPDAWAPMKIAKTLGIFPQKDHALNYSYIFRKRKGDKMRVPSRDVIGQFKGIIDKYSHEKRIPMEYIFNTEDVRVKLLQGLLDSEGSIYKAENRFVVRYDTVSPGLVEDITLLLHSLGISCSTYTRLQVDKRNQYSIRMSIPRSDMAKYFTYPPKLRIAMDAAGHDDFKRFDTLRIVDIQKVEPTEQRCIMINDPDHVYLTEHFIPTHNSVILLKSALDIRKYNPGWKTKTPGMRPCVLYITMENSFTETIERMWNLCFDDSIVDHPLDEAIEMLCKEMGITKFFNDDENNNVVYDNKEEEGDIIDRMHGKSSKEPNIEVIVKYFSYREINTDDLFTIIQDLRDENLEVVALSFDYIKRIRPNVVALDSVKMELNRIINELKALSVILDIPVITAHQMNRAAAATVDNAIRQGKGDVTKLVGRENIGDAWEVQETGDFVCVLNIEKKPGTDDRYMIMSVVKRRRVDSMAGELSNITYLAHPFHKNNGLRLIDDMNLDKVLSLQTLTTDIDEVVPKEKLNAVPRESKILPVLNHSIENDDDIF